MDDSQPDQRPSLAGVAALDRTWLADASRRGHTGGPKFKVTPIKIRQARAMYDEGGYTVQETADTFRVCWPTIYRYLAQHAEQA